MAQISNFQQSERIHFGLHGLMFLLLKIKKCFSQHGLFLRNGNVYFCFFYSGIIARKYFEHHGSDFNFSLFISKKCLTIDMILTRNNHISQMPYIFHVLEAYCFHR